MTALKDSIHALVDRIEDEGFLMQIKRMLASKEEAESGNFWDSLPEAQQNEILTAWEESFEEENLIPHADVLKRM